MVVFWCQELHFPTSFMAQETKGQEWMRGDGSRGVAPHQDEMQSGDACSVEPSPRIKVQRWNAVAFWSYDLCPDTCAICRNALLEPSIEFLACPSNNNENGISIGHGECNHAFHMDCIQRWLKRRESCPLCNRPWEFIKIERIPGYGELYPVWLVVAVVTALWVHFHYSEFICQYIMFIFPARTKGQMLNRRAEACHTSPSLVQHQPLYIIISTTTTMYQNSTLLWK